jgi:hypothetical protein
MRWMVPYVNQRRNGVAQLFFRAAIQIPDSPGSTYQLIVCGKPTETLELASLLHLCGR